MTDETIVPMEMHVQQADILENGLRFMNIKFDSPQEVNMSRRGCGEEKVILSSSINVDEFLVLLESHCLIFACHWINVSPVQLEMTKIKNMTAYQDQFGVTWVLERSEASVPMATNTFIGTIDSGKLELMDSKNCRVPSSGVYFECAKSHARWKREEKKKPRKRKPRKKE